MDSIIQAVDMVKANENNSRSSTPPAVASGVRRPQPELRYQSVKLDAVRLERNRIVSHKSSAPSQGFDVLRTQLLQDMDKNGWQCIGITSPTAGCGKSTIACNLAISIARMADRTVVLVDLNLRRPTIRKYLGLPCEAGTSEVLEGKSDITASLLQTSIGTTSFLTLPAKEPHSHASDLLASQSLPTLLQSLKREFRNRIVILDLPSLLDGDEALSVLPHVDAALLVAAAGGGSTISDVRDCRRYLEHTPVIRVVLNKLKSSNGSGSRF